MRLQRWNFNGWLGLLGTALNSNPATHEADSDSDNDGLKDGTELTAGTQAQNGDGDDDYFTYTLESGSLPAGLGLDASVPGVWALSGTPMAAGSHTFTLRVTDAYQRTDTQQLTLVVEPDEPPPPPSLQLATTALPPGGVGTPYSATLLASGGSGTYAFSASGTLPAGLILAETGTLSGTPTGAGEFDVTFQINDGTTTLTGQSLHLSIADMMITTATLPPGTVSAEYTASINAVNGSAPYLFSVVPVTGDTGLPFGYMLAGNGVLTGTHTLGSTMEGTYTFTVQVTDSTAGTPRVALKQLSLTLADTTPPLAITTTTLPNAGVNSSYTGSVQATGAGALTFTASGLPDWLQMSASGQLSGTPPSQAVGAYTFTVEVQDEVYDSTLASYRKVSAAVALVVAAAGTGGTGGTNSPQARPVPRGRPTAVPYTVPDDDDPTLPGEPALPRPRPTPRSAPPGAGILFSAIRVKTLDYIGGQELKHPTETTQTGGENRWEKPGPEPKQPEYADDGFNGDADLEGDNADPGDPRDDVPTVPQTWVPATQGEEGAVQHSHGFSSFTRNTGPYEEPGSMQGTYTAKNAYTPPDEQEQKLTGGFDNAVARSLLANMNYQRGDGANGWMGNGAMGVRGTFASASLVSGTDIDAPVITYTNGNGQQQTSTVKYNTEDANLRQSELRLQTNVAIASGQPTLSAVFTLRKITEGNDGGTPTTTEFQAVLKLSITSGKVSNTVEVLSGTLPPDVTVTGGVVSLRPPAAVEGKYIRYDLLPVEIKRDVDMPDGDWQTITGQLTKALPGQQINLRLELPSGITATNFTWSLPGKTFVEYVPPTPELGQLQLVEAEDIDDQEVHFYWADTGSKVVTVSFNLEGKNIEFPVTIDVEKPTATLTATGGASNIGASEYNPASMQLQVSPRVTFTGSVSIPSSYGDQGEWSFEQLVTPNCSAVRYDGVVLRQDSGIYHDGGPYPYEGPFQTGTTETTGDSPSIPLKSDYNEATADMAFDMYLMFKPPGIASRQVPLRRLHWSWKDKAQYDPSTFEWKKVHIQGVQKEDSADESTHPEWSDSSDQHIDLK